MKRATIAYDNGVVVVNFKKVSKREPCDFVRVSYLDNGVAIISGYQEAWEYQDKHDVDPWQREDVDIAKARPEYVDQAMRPHKPTRWERFRTWLNPYHNQTLFVPYAEVKPGWVRLKAEYERGYFTIETSNWRVIDKYGDDRQNAILNNKI